MPKAFMITHRRFVDDSGSIIAGNDHSITGENVIIINNNNINTISNSCSNKYHRDKTGWSDVKMLSGGTDVNRARLSSCSSLDSPPLKKRLSSRIIVQEKGGAGEGAGGSDADSDSGCSSHNEVRYQLPEVELSWECPSNFSLMLDLMTQSPQRCVGRDVIDLSSEVKSPLRRTSRDESESGRWERELGEMRNQEEHFRYKPYLERAAPGHKPLVASADNMGRKYKPFKQGSRLFERNVVRDATVSEDGVYTGQEWCAATSEYMRSSDGGHIGSLDLSLSAEPRAPVRTTSYESKWSEYRPSSYHLHHHHYHHHHAQRRMSFDSPNADVLTSDVPTSTSPPQRPSSPLDQPIDYSQLSTRRLEVVKTEKPCDSMQQGMPGCEGELMKQPSPVRTRATDRSMEETHLLDASRLKYDFILSPSMDRDGKLIPTPLQQHMLTPQKGRGHELIQEESPISQCASYPAYEHRLPSGSSVQQCSPPSASPASPPQPIPEMKIKVKGIDPIEETKPLKRNDLTSSTGTERKMSYHPKLKYLLAASHYNSGFQKGRVPSKVPTSSPSHSHEPQHRDDAQPGITSLNKGDVEAPYSACLKDLKSDQLLTIPSLESSGAHCHPQPYNGGETTVPKSPSSFLQNPAPTESNLFLQLSEVSQRSQIKSDPSSAHDVIQAYQESISETQQAVVASSDTERLRSRKSSPACEKPLTTVASVDQQSTLSELLFSSPRKSGVDPYACVDCGKRYSTSSNLARHRQTHRSVCDKKARKCPHCEKVYVSMPAYSMHVRTHNQGCECPHCGKKFSRPWLLQGHIRTHTGEKPFGCSQCGKSFADKSNLRAHIQTHSTDKPYMCGRCGKAFALKSYLYKHEESSCMRGQRFRP